MSEQQFNIPIQTIELSDEINSSDEMEETQQTERRIHHRKNVDQDWFDEYIWLEAEEINEETFIFCKICRNRNGISRLAKGTNIFRLDRIKSHQNTKEHKESELMLFDSDQSESSRDNIEQSDKEKLSIILLMRNTYFCSKQNISLTTYPDLCNLISLQIENNIGDEVYTLKPASLEKPAKFKSKYGSYTNHKAAFDFLDSITSVIKKSLFEELDSSTYWSIMIDESNSIDNDKYLAIVGKYIINNIPYMRYLGMINLESAVAENIYNQVLSFCVSNGISYHKIIHFGSDGASNMIGNKSGVATRLKKINPFMSSIHCISHRLHLAGKDASDEVEYFQQYEKIL